MSVEPPRSLEVQAKARALSMTIETPCRTRRGWRMGAGFCALAIVALLLPGNMPVQAADRPESFADLAESLTPAVVNISTTQTPRRRPDGAEPPESPFPPGSPFDEFFREFFDQRSGNGRRPSPRITSLGSGFVIDRSGYIVTNNHVVDNADEITVKLADGRTFDATIVGVDSKTDLVVLKVEAHGDLPYVTFGDSDASRVGDWVLAIGNPFGLGGTVTAGIISARNRDINAGPYDDFIQTDAAINKGNSGGPMFNAEGEVIGINTAIFSPTGASVGIGFAIPSNLAQSVISQLREFGETRRGWLGVYIQTVTDEIAESLGLEKTEGALVSDVNRDGPAEAAGIRQGDVILTFNGSRISEMRELPRLVAETPVGENVEVTLWRQGEIEQLSVTLGRLEEGEKLAAATERTGGRSTLQVDALGLELSAITDELRSRYDIEETIEGVIVTGVAGGSSAEENGVRPGEVILEVEREPVAVPEDVVEKMRAVEAEGRKTVFMLLHGGGEQHFVALRIETEE